MFNFRVSTSPSDVATPTGVCDWSFPEDHLDSVQTQTGTMQRGQGGHREDPVLQRKGAFEGPREHKPLRLNKYPTLNVEV